MKFVSKRIIELNKELSDLDLFTFDFVRILKKYSNYVIVSGYVSILLGRARASEDIDIIIPPISYLKFTKLLKELKQHRFYCLNAENLNSIYDYINNKLAIRFAKVKTVIPNIELKFAKNKIDKLAFDRFITVKLDKDKIFISNLELQIIFKEIVLKSPKDIEDARHIRNIASKNLDRRLIAKYEMMINEFYQ